MRKRAIGARIAQFRRKSGLTLDAMSERTGVPVFRCAQIEAGRVDATVDELHAIKTALKIRVKDFFGRLSEELGSADRD